MSLVGFWKCRSCTSSCGSASGIGERHVVGLHPRDAHVRVHRGARDVHVLDHLEAEHTEELDRLVEVEHRHGHVVEGRVAAHACSCSRPLVELHVVALRILEEHAAHEPAGRLAVHRGVGARDRRRRP